MPKPSREPRGRKNEWESLPESKSEVESYLSSRKETPKQTEQKYVWSYLPESLQEIEDRRQKQYQDLQAQRANIIPTATGNMDAEYAGYNKALAEYGAYWGDKAAHDEGFANYKAALDRLNGQYDSHAARHAEADKMVDERIARTSGMQGAGNRMTDADRRFVRDTALYNRMGKDANTAGDYALYQRAAQGYNKAVSDHATNYGQAQSEYWNAAKTEQPGYYYANTMSADDVDKRLEELRATKEKVHENLMRVLSDIDNNPHTPEERQRLSDTKYRIQDRYTNINNEIDYLETAKGLHKQRRGDDMYNYWLNEGGLEKPENYAKVEQGKAKYEADQLAASGGMKEPEIATPAGGAIKAYRNRNQKENEWDNIFDNAPNLTPSDEMVFYALYADDPEQAMEWAYYINNRRNSEFQGEMAEWGHEHPGWAWLGGLGNRMISGVANIVDQNSAFAQKQSLQSTGLMSGGAQALNEWSGTIDTDIPIIKDLFNGKGAGDFYQLASSIVESGINMAVASYTGDAAKLVGALGTFIMGSSAAAADYNESLQRGLTTAQAQRHALAAGINEAAFEFISLDKVIKADKLAGQLKKVFVDAGIEASEEFCTTVANRVADGYLARTDGYDTQVEQRTKELIALGLSRAEAEAQAEREWRVELINDAIGGFISGGFHAGIEWGGGKVANKIATNQYNETAGIMTDADEIAALRAYADEHGITYNEKALRGMEDTDSSTSLRSAQNDNVENAEKSGRQRADSTETMDADFSPTAQNDNEETTKKKQSRREARQERKSNRATGALRTQVEAHIAKAAHESGLNNAQAFFEQTVSRYGEGITRTAQNAVANEARTVFGQASSQAELTDLYQKALEGVTAQPVKHAIKEGYQTATTLRAYRGDNEALRDALVGPGNGGKLNLEAEITGKDGSTQQVRIASLDAERGKVKLDNGEIVALNELQGLDADTKDVIERLDRFDLGDTRALAFHSYLLAAAKGDVTDGVRFVMEYALAYDQGRNGVVSMEKATEQSSLPADIVKEAYEHGERQTETWRKDQERKNAEKRAKAKDGATGRKGILDSSRVSQETLDKLSADKKDALRTFELLAEASGVDIRLIAQSADKKGNVKGYQGLYNKDGNYIEIDINAGLNNIFKDLHTGMTAVLGHELTHWMQENAPTEYLAYKKAVLKAIMSTNNGQLRLERMIEAQINQNKREGKEISRSQAEDEVVADASMKRLGDSEFWDAVADNLGNKKADVFAKIKEYISQFFNRVRELIGKASHTSEAAKLIDRVEADVQATLRRLYAEGIGAAMRNSAQIVRDAEILGASEQMIEDAATQYSSRIDDETLQFLDNQEHVTVYRAMQVIDGKLYPPMAAKIEGKLVEPTEIGKWYQSVERPDLVKNGKFTLNNGNGTSVPAAYNPYFHCSASPLNDQFSSAYKRPNLVVVEGIIPKSELTSGYRAEGAKNTVGETTWHAGPVASKLKGDKARRVFLSRWFQIQRIMTDAEVAGIVAKTLEGENVSVPSNVVTPGLLEALRSEGVQIDETGIQRQSRKNSATDGGEENRRVDLRDIVKYSTRPQFEGDTPVEVVRDLVAVHNMTEQNLRDVLELGGFPSPSIAIVKAANGHTNYGPISVVFGRDSIDPALDSRNKVYGADAWTPTAANAQVDTEVNYDVRRKLDRAIYGLSQKTAGGKFARSALFSGFLDDVTRMSADEILDRTARSEAAIAAYLADKGETVEPIYQQKNVSTDRWGNKLLGLINDVIKERGYETQIYDLMNSGTLVKANEDLTGIVREALERQIEQSSKKPEPIRRNLQRRLDLLNDARVEELLLHAWAYQNEGERTEQEFDYAATLDAMKQKIDPEHRIDGLMEDKVQDTVKAWLRPQIEGLLGKKGIRNERDKFTASGSERSFNALHDAYTLENIVKAMNRSAARGSNTFGVTSGSLQSVTAPEYRSIDEIKKNKNRLAKVEDAKYKQLKADVETEISEIIDAIYNSKETSDGYMSALDEIGEALISAARTNRTTASIQNVFARDTEYKLSKENAQRISDLYKKAAALPTEYFEAKPQRAMGFDEVKAVILPSNTDRKLVQGLQGQGVPVYFFQTGNDAQRTDILNSLDDAKFSTRDYSDSSDLDLLLNAANEISEGGGEDYWASLLKSDPGIAGEAEEIKRLGKQLKKTEAELAEAQRNLTLTDRKLKTRGIATLAATIMQDQKAGDINKKDVKNRIAAVLTDAYQKALDQLDAGADVSDAWETVYQEGVVKAADILLSDATYAEKHGYGWLKTSLGQYLGEGAREYVEADIAARVAQDFDANRYRPGQKATVADRLVAQAENRVNKKLDAAKTENAALKAENAKLTETKDFYKEQADTAKATAGELYQQLLDKREELKNNKKISADERKATLKKLDNMTRQMQAKRREAEVWKSKSEIGWKAANKAVQEKEAAVAKLEKQLQREKDILEGKLKPPAIQKMLKAAREREAEKTAQHKDEVFARYKEQKNETALRGRIKNLHDEMNRDLLKPREGHFVPQGLIRPVVDLLDMVNTQTKRAKSESAQAKIDAINAAYDRIKNDERYSQYYDETVKEMLTELSATLEGRSIYELSYSELEDVYTVMKAMRTTIRNSIKADMIERGKEVWEVGNALRQELRAGKGANPLLLEKYHMAMLSAERAFHRFGGYMPDSTWDKTYRMLDNAQLKMLMLEMQATRLFDSVLLGKADFAKAEALTSYDKKDLVDVGLKDANGNAVPITRGMMLSLYMHLQNEENMRHLMYGGLTLPDFRRYYKGQENAWGKGSVSIPALGARVANLNELLDAAGEAGVTAQYEAEQQAMREMWESVRGAIEDQLSEYDRKWIAASKDFFDNFSRRELNRVTNEMYGFSKAKVDNYFPIVTDKNFLKTDFDSISRDISLENAGFMKERVKAGNPILLEDITKAVNRQISNVARYAGLTQALKTFNNVYNVQTKGYTDSVKKAMSETFEDTGKKYIENLITDMVGGRTQPGTIFDRIKGNYAQAVLSANLSVTIKQAASFWTAAATVGWKPLMKALAKGGQKGHVISRADKALIGTYTPLLWKRSQGAIDTEIGDMAHAQDWTKKAKWLMGWIEKTDIATVGRLWYAAEYYVKENFDLAKGTEAQIKNGESPFYKKVAEVFNQIVEDTQPNYTILQRPDILRNPNKLVRAMTMFSTQRFQNANILIDAAGEYNAMRRYNKKSNTAESKAALKAAKQKLTRAISSQVVSAAVLNVMTLVAAALMHRMNPWRDDDDEITAESIREELMNGFLSTMAGSFLAGSELYEAISSMLTGSKYYGNDVGGISTINEFATAVVQFGQQAVKLIGDENSKPSDWAKLAEKQLAKVGQYLAQMTGIPAANINKIIAGGKNHIIDAVNGEFFSFEAGVERSAAVNANRYLKAWIADDDAKLETVKAEMMGNYKEAGKNEEEANRALKTKLTATAKDAFVAGTLDETDAILFLAETGYYDENEAWLKVKEWKAENEHADDEDYSWSKYEDLYAAMDSDADIEPYRDELESHGVKADTIKNAVVDHVKERYEAGEIDADEAMRLLQKYKGMSENDAYWKVDAWDAKEEAEANGEKATNSNYRDLYAAIDANADASAAIQELTAHGYKERDVYSAAKDHLVERFEKGEINETQFKNQLSRYAKIVKQEDVDPIVNNAKCYKETGYRLGSLNESYLDGEITAEKYKQIRVKYGGKTAEEAKKQVRWLDLKKAHPDLDITESVSNNWYDGTTKTRENGHESAKAAGMSIEAYLKAKATLDAIKDSNDNGTGEDEVIAAIAKMNLTARQKDALYYERYKGGARKGIYKTW